MRLMTLALCCLLCSARVTASSSSFAICCRIRLHQSTKKDHEVRGRHHLLVIGPWVSTFILRRGLAQRERAGTNDVDTRLLQADKQIILHLMSNWYNHGGNCPFRLHPRKPVSPNKEVCATQGWGVKPEHPNISNLERK